MLNLKYIIVDFITELIQNKFIFHELINLFHFKCHNIKIQDLFAIH
jgi:hypothetical protein